VFSFSFPRRTCRSGLVNRVDIGDAASPVTHHATPKRMGRSGRGIHRLIIKQQMIGISIMATELETIEDAMRALVKFTQDLKSLTATLQKAATAAAAIDPAAVAFFHRLRMVLLDMSHQIATLELPPKFRDAR
jgi:hypothetical protein